MARKRIIDPEFWSDQEIGFWSYEARLFYIGLWNFADDEGRLKAHHKLLQAQIFPYDLKINVQKLKEEIADKVEWYVVNGQEYGNIKNFLKHQRIDRPQASKIPPPTGEISVPMYKETIDAVYTRYGKQCQYCGKSGEDTVIDHIIPWCRGGRHNLENLTIACRSCNSIKRDRVLHEMNNDFVANMYNKSLYEYSKQNIESSTQVPPNTTKDKIREDKINGHSFDFEEIWSKYPSKVGKKEAERYFRSSVRTQQDFLDIGAALENYKQSERVRKGYVQNGSTWFNDWKGWVKKQTPRREPDKSCTNCGGSGSVYAPGSGINAPCYCTNIEYIVKKLAQATPREPIPVGIEQESV